MKVASILLVVVLTLSCQRGEEDPTISFISRKARLVGDWNVIEMTSKNAEFEAILVDTNIQYSYADSSRTLRPFTWACTFERTGDFFFTTTENFPADSVENIVAHEMTTETKGTWEFTGGNATPAKSQLALLISEVKISRTDQGSNINVISTEGASLARVYNIVKLTSKEMKLSFKTTTNTAFGNEEELLDLTLKKQD